MTTWQEQLVEALIPHIQFGFGILNWAAEQMEVDEERYKFDLAPPLYALRENGKDKGEAVPEPVEVDFKAILEVFTEVTKLTLVTPEYMEIGGTFQGHIVEVVYWFEPPEDAEPCGVLDTKTHTFTLYCGHFDHDWDEALGPGGKRSARCVVCGKIEGDPSGGGE